jgi:hypothetical protein
MSFDWLAWSNPVAIWWGFLVSVSAANIALLCVLYRAFQGKPIANRTTVYSIEAAVLLLCAAYVFGCAFRSVLPRADVQRIVLFDTWLSSVAVGRSVATVAELCFAAQWALLLHLLARMTRADTARNIANAIVPLILLAEACSWYAVITTNYVGNAIENSLWAVAFLLIAAALCRLLVEFHGVIRWAMAVTVTGIVGYLAFLLAIDVPMYFGRWHADLAAGKATLGLFAGLQDVSTRWIVTHDIAHWHDEIAWMSLYFSVAVWSSIALASVALVKERLVRYRARPGRSGAAGGLRYGWSRLTRARSTGNAQA